MSYYGKGKEGGLNVTERGFDAARTIVLTLLLLAVLITYYEPLRLKIMDVDYVRKVAMFLGGGFLALALLTVHN